METPASNEITQQLVAWSKGDAAALEQLIPAVYQELRRMADRYLRSEGAGHTLQPTALVHEAYLRLIDQTQVQWQNRAHFFGVAVQMMRRILLDHAKTKHREKRGGAAHKLSLDEAANDAVRLGLSESRWQRLVKRGRNYSREMAEAQTDDEAIQIASDAVHEWRAGQRSGR